MTGLIGQYVHGNEPCHHVAYLYNYAGAPWKTQARIRQVMTSLYNNSAGRAVRQRRLRPDVGLVRAQRLGLLSGQPGLGRLRDRQPAGRARRRSTSIRSTTRGATFTIVAENNSPKNIYIQSADAQRQAAGAVLVHARRTGGRRRVGVEDGAETEQGLGAETGRSPAGSDAVARR